MIEELNRMIEKGALALAPLKPAGKNALSTNPIPEGVLFP